MASLTPRDRFIRALLRKPIVGRIPHFELEFFLTMEAFGRVHPSHRNYSQWFQMSGKEKQLHREDIADLHIKVAERYEHDAIFLHPNPGSVEETIRVIDAIRDKTGDKYFLMIHGDVTFGIGSGAEMEAFAYRLADEPEKLKQEATERVDRVLAKGEAYAQHGGLDGFALCTDYCFNSGPFISPAQFGEFVTPYLARETKEYREMGFYVIKHTDGNIMPILDQLIETNPHALHSLDPQGGVDIAEVKRMVGDQVCLIGNVNCGLLQTGTQEEMVASAEYAIEHGAPGGGYIFSTSNCVYTGMPLENYELIRKVWRQAGNYDETGLQLKPTQGNDISC